MIINKQDTTAIKLIDEVSDWFAEIPHNFGDQCLFDLEHGHVLYFPKLAFTLTQEQCRLLSPVVLEKGRKNISFDIRTHRLLGFNPSTTDQIALEAVMKRFVQHTQTLVTALFPSYKSAIEIGRTSFRPANISTRYSSYRKDDTRLHVDAFVSTPTAGKRILRVFSNVNQDGVTRDWRIGEPFDKVIKQFVHRLRPPLPGERALLHRLGLTKTKRTLYDHYMLGLHNKMKADTNYQTNASQEAFAFPANTSWIVFTDQVSHAAMSGQHLLEQTFYLPVSAQRFPAQSPLKQLEVRLHKAIADQSAQ